jgi:hypothetical protein
VRQVASPCYLLDITWNMLAWNSAAQALFTGWLDTEQRPNMMTFMFQHPLSQTLVCDWENRASRIVAELRADTMYYQHDQGLNAFVTRMNNDSETFREYWSRQQVVVREGGERTFSNAQGKLQQFRQVSWQLTSNRSVKMIMLMPE